MTTSELRKRADLPTATAHEHRLRIYQATRRPARIERKITTAWGTIRVKGKIGQAHADLMDAILYCAKKKAETSDGRIKILVDPAEVRRRADITSGDQLRRLVDDLLQVVIEVYEPAELACVGHLVDHIDKAQRGDGTYITRPNPLGGGERHMWRVEIGKALCLLLDKDIWRGYDPSPIARLRHGISQAVARHIMTHSQEPRGGWTLDGLIRAVAGDEIDGQDLRNRRREIQADAAGLAAAGIEVDGDRVRSV